MVAPDGAGRGSGIAAPQLTRRRPSAASSPRAPVSALFLKSRTPTRRGTASVRIHGSNRAARERLLRYCARPPFALDRLRIEREPGTASDDAGVRRVFYRPARPTRDGRTLLALSPLESLDALSRLIPPPRVHHHRYHGVLASNARLRGHVTAPGREVGVETAEARGVEASPADEDSADGPTGAAARSRWAQLLPRIYKVFRLRCPECGSDMRILAFLTDPEPAGAILRHLKLPHTPPRLSPARGPPQAALEFDADPVARANPLPADDFDQTPAFDPTEPEPIPELDLDQTPGA